MTVPPKNHYELLGVALTASADDVKRAFRQQIARYHPDKVQHLGKELQEMAALRAAALTEAYHVLSDESRRAEYDRGVPMAAATPTTSSAHSEPPPPGPIAGDEPGKIDPPAGGGDSTPRVAFDDERAGRDEFVRRATVIKLREALAGFAGDYAEASVRGFDVAWLPKSKMFGRRDGPRLLGRIVPCVDRVAVVDAWTAAGLWVVPEDICVLLVGSSVVSQHELADTVATQRRKPTRGGKVTVIPIDARDWTAHVPIDAPPVAKTVVARLRNGT